MCLLKGHACLPSHVSEPPWPGEHVSPQPSHQPRLAPEQLRNTHNGSLGLRTLSASASCILTFTHIIPLPTIINGFPLLSE